jgi:hypothetical protein
VQAWHVVVDEGLTGDTQVWQQIAHVGHQTEAVVRDTTSTRRGWGKGATNHKHKPQTTTKSYHSQW